MSDKEYYEQLCSNSIDGTLTDSEREKLEAHLAECPSCAALKQDLEQMHALFSTEAALPDGLHEKIMQCVELDGLSCREIAETVGKPPKSVDNAVQRIRRKVARQLLSGDLSGS